LELQVRRREREGRRERERERGSRTSAEPSAKSRGRAKVQVNFWVFAQIFRPHVADDVHSIDVIDQGFVEGGGGGKRHASPRPENGTIVKIVS
jgi:hypothetical protein